MSFEMMVALAVGGVSIIGIWVLASRTPHVVDDNWVPPSDEDVGPVDPLDEDMPDAGVLGRIRAKELQAEQSPAPPTLSTGRWPMDPAQQPAVDPYAPPGAPEYPPADAAQYAPAHAPNYAAELA